MQNGLVALLQELGVAPEAAIAKLQGQIAQLERQMAPLSMALAEARKNLRALTGDAPKTSPTPRRAAAGTTHTRTAAPWSPETLVPRQQTGKLPGDPVAVHEFASEKLARARLVELHRVGFAHSSSRPLYPGELDFLVNRHGWMILVVPQVIES